jgi:ABC-2 type transport system permease protein
VTTTAIPVAVPTVRIAGGTFSDDVRAMKMVWRRELIRFFRNRIRIFTSLMQPILFLFVLGSGLGGITRGVTGNLSFKTFMFPGVLAMAVLFTAIFSAISIVWDREFGFLREMMVAPVRRSSIVLGKCAGGATVAAFQGVIVLAIAGLVEVPYSLGLMAELFALMVLLAFAITAFGMMAAARISQMQSFMALMQMAIMPMFFISGAMFSVASLPSWLAILNRVDPLTYAVDPMRRAIFAHLDIPAKTREALAPGVTWWGWHVPALVEAAVIALLGLIMLAVAIAEFSRTE